MADLSEWTRESGLSRSQSDIAESAEAAVGVDDDDDDAAAAAAGDDDDDDAELK